MNHKHKTHRHKIIDKRNEARRLRGRRNIEYIRVCKELSGCEVCGENRVACLDFHHKDPNNKRFGLANKAEKYSTAHIDAEMRKCVVL